MNQELFQIACIQKKMERNRSMRFKVKVGAAAVVLVISLWSLLSVSETKTLMFVLWLISFPVLVLFYFLDKYLVKESKTLEFDKFRLEVERRERNKELAKYRKELLRDYELEHLDQSFERPAWDMVSPINYYIVLAILDVLNVLLIIFDVRLGLF